MKLKQFSLAVLFFWLTFLVGAQPYGNEWIDYNQTYYHFPIVEDGVYRISYQELLAAGFPVASIQANQIQVFGKEKQIPVYVSASNNQLEEDDYIEFYAQGNDGWLDSLLYDNPTDIGNPAYSLYNDTLHYFLTWSNNPNNSLRYTLSSSLNYNAYSPISYVWDETIQSYHSRYYGGYSASSSYSSFYSPGEGWGGSNRNGANGYSETIQLQTKYIYDEFDAPNARFNAISNSNSNASYTGQGNHHLRWEFGQNNLLLHDEVFTGYRITVVDKEIESHHLAENSTPAYFKIIGDQGAVTDYQSLSYIALKYPKKTQEDATFFTWDLAENTGNADSLRIDIKNSNLTQPNVYVLGGFSPKKIGVTEENGTWKGLFPNHSKYRKIIVSDESQIKSVSKIKPVNGSGTFQDYTHAVLDSVYIIVYDKSMISSVTEYENYRKSPAGGAYNVLKIEVNDAWMQYGGGVAKHILGTRRVVNQIYNLSVHKPAALLLAGKAITESPAPNTSGASPRTSTSRFARNLVPSYGAPSSDLAITAKWNGSAGFTPAIATGRIAAENDAQLILYLDKVKTYEGHQDQNSVYNKPEKEWQKQVLHFGGGMTAPEQQLLKSYLNGMKFTIEGSQFGGTVASYFKQVSTPFNPVLTAEVNDYLQKGVSIINFFGHASNDGFDQNIDDPINWGNHGKYPLVIGNGCYTGNIFGSNVNSTSERFVLVDNLGAIGFMASTELGYASYLNLYTAELYRQISQKSYGKPYGEQMNKTIAHLENVNSSFLVEVMVMQMVYHGDPMIHINWHKRPEIDVTEQDVFFTPEDITFATDSITCNVVLTNLGKSIEDTFDLTVIRSFPGSPIDSVYHLDVKGLDFKDTFQITMPVQTDVGAGMNQFTIQADIPSFVPELYDEYGNNQTTKNLFIDIGGIIPVLPYNYAVVPEDSVVLKASTINPIADFNTYRFEIDTTDTYDSPFKKYAVVNGLGGVKEVFPNEWKNESSNAVTPLVLEDSVSYYWRVAIDSSELNWTEHSFQYIPGKEGWGQAHFYQFKNGGFHGIEYDRNSRKRNFQESPITIQAQLYDNANSNFEYSSTMWKINGQDIEYGLCGTSPSLHVCVVSPVGADPWGSYYNGANENHQFGNANNGGSCRSRVENYFVFRQNSTQQLEAFVNMLENEIPDGHFVVVYTARRAEYGNWDSYYPAIFDVMENMGATGMSPDAENRGFITIFQKGDPSQTVTVHAQESGEFISASKEFNSLSGTGIESSTIIGPAAKWHTVYWSQSALETPSHDSTRLVIRGLDYAQQVQTEIDTLFTANDSIINFNSILPAEDYPYLQLQAIYYDSVHVTPAQVKRWHVLYDKLPEAAIDGTNGYVFLPESVDSLQEGVDMSFAVDVKNISDLPMDSLLVHYWIVDGNQARHEIPYQRQDSLRVGEVFRDTVHFSSIGLRGKNTLWMEVNPYTNGPNNEWTDQPELAHFNNLLQIPFEIGGDDINPILDVTFDGEHILNNDIVNPRAEIMISLQDENPFMVMDSDADTTNFGIYLTDPDGEQKKIPFIDGDGNQILEWIPADESNLRFKILYHADFDKNGTYELLVQGSDKAGNLSGSLEYKIQFEVVLESTITHVMNYPNPFSTRTQFVFTLTGTETPDDMIIQIMTVTGRIVREITVDELGPLRIGRNITDYAWDGRDEFGDQLANGVYLYRVKARMDGENIKLRSSGADPYFKRNWGKMYLMR